MNNFKFLLLACSVFLAFSCKKDNILNDSFSCKIDGNKYESSGIYAYATDFGTYTNIYGLQNTGTEVMYLGIPKNASTGTYNFDSSYPAYYTAPDGVTYATLWGTGSGSVTITETSATNIKGTFKFTAYDADTETQKIEVTEGKFNVGIQ